MFKVYCITNLITQKSYVGFTSKTVEERWSIHRTLANQPKNACHKWLHKSIRKYGTDSFLVQLLEEFETEKEALEAEKFYVNYLQTYRPNGYNLTAGGEGVLNSKWSDEAKQKQSKKLKGRKLSPEACKNISAAKMGDKNPMFGKCGSLNHNYGNHNPRVLTLEEIKGIKDRYSKGDTSVRKLGKEYNVSRETIRKYVNQNWDTIEY